MASTWPPRLQESLILSPQSDQDHFHNLAVLMGEEDLVMEREYRKAYPYITHAEYVRLTNHPDFWDKFYCEVRAKVGISNYRRILDKHATQALNGDIQSAKFVFAELRISEERREALAALSQATGAKAYFDKMGEVLERTLAKKTKMLEAQVEVK